MELLIESNGHTRCVYAEDIDLSELGQVTIRRGSHVEPTTGGQWTADLSPVGGPLLGPCATRSEALTAEVTWLRTNWLTSST